MKYNVLIEEFCETYGLGKVKKAHLLPTGLGNRAYVVKTVTGKYVIKALNPSKIKTADDIKKLEITEYIAELANQNGVTSISAKKLNGKVVNVLHEQHYIVFDFFEGKIIPLKRITPLNCFEVGRLLADLHNMNFKELSESNLIQDLQEHHYGDQLEAKVNWKYYLEQSSKYAPQWLAYLEDNIHDLYHVFNDSFAAYLAFIPQDIVIAHGDMFNHNILWDDNVPHIIDWEQAGFIDATYDCLYTAMRWATTRTASDEKVVDKSKFYAFFEGYTERRKLNVENLEISLHMVLYKRLAYLRGAFNKYLNPKDEIAKERAEKQIAYAFSIFQDYKNLINQLEDLKQCVIELQPRQEYEKSPSYKIIPKMKQLIKNYDSQIDIAESAKELNQNSQGNIGSKMFRKIKSIFIKN